MFVYLSGARRLVFPRRLQREATSIRFHGGLHHAVTHILGRTIGHGTREQTNGEETDTNSPRYVNSCYMFHNSVEAFFNAAVPKLLSSYHKIIRCVTDNRPCIHAHIYTIIHATLIVLIYIYIYIVLNT